MLYIATKFIYLKKSTCLKIRFKKRCLRSSEIELCPSSACFSCLLAHTFFGPAWLCIKNHAAWFNLIFLIQIKNVTMLSTSYYFCLKYLCFFRRLKVHSHLVLLRTLVLCPYKTYLPRRFYIKLTFI